MADIGELIRRREANKRYRARLRGENIPIRTRPYSSEERRLIEAEYRSPLFCLALLAKRLNRPKSNISRYARSIGLSRRNRKKLFLTRKAAKPEQKMLPGLFSVGMWDRNVHPRGMLGKTHSDEYRKVQQERMKKQWQDPGFYPNTKAGKQDLSDRLKAIRASNRITNPYSRALKGTREDLGMFFKSRWEANFARYLNLLKRTGNIHDWSYEKERFEFHKIKRGTRSYCPDFKVWDTPVSVPYFYEVKGWMDKKSMTRLKRMRIYYPSIKIIVIGPAEYKDIKNKVSALIPHWE
jgi:hypothetical protein